MEGLESRNLMAGNVSVSVVDGVLRVQGDEKGNNVQISQVAQTFTGEWPGAKYEITGGNRYNNAPSTTINGQTSVIVEGVKNGAAIGLGQGNNYLRVSKQIGGLPSQQAGSLPGTVTINSGSGMDLIRLYVQNPKQVTINSGGENDRIEIHRSKLNKLTINADWSGAAALPRAGNDQVVMGSTVVQGAADVYMGPDFLHAGDNLTLGFGMTFNGGLSFDGVASSLYWRGPSTSEVVGPLDIIAQWVSIDLLNVQGSMRVTGEGTVSGGGLEDVTVSGQLSMFGLAGDDVFSLLNVQAAETLLDGGDDEDTYRDFGGNDLGELTLVSIERQEQVA